MPSTLRADCIRVLDLDGSLLQQRELLNCKFLNGNAEIVELQNLAPRLRFLSTRAAMREFASTLDISQRDVLTFYGSGDFHHLSSVLIGQWSTPLSVVVFDNHPDWDISSPWPCCGSWVNEVLKFPHVKKVAVIGLGRYDLRGWNLLRGNTAALDSGELELYPVSWRRSKRFFAHDVYWKTIARQGIERVTKRVLQSLPTSDIYLSVDKDCLRAQSALTNWEEGEVDLLELMFAIERIRCEKNIVGADITGEYSRGAVSNLFFDLISNWNHPKTNHPKANHPNSQVSPALFPQRALETNQQTNLALLRAFQKASQGTAGAVS